MWANLVLLLILGTIAKLFTMMVEAGGFLGAIGAILFFMGGVFLLLMAWEWISHTRGGPPRV